MKKLDLTGKRFGRLTAVCEGERLSGRVAWMCVCECGGTAHVSRSNLTSGTVKSCGCLWRESITSHGHATNGNQSRTYNSWVMMHRRCKDSRKNYEHVSVCDRWATFENFLADMGERPPHTSIDRIDPYGNYEPSNCRWATRSEQNSNQRRHHPAPKEIQ